MPVTEYMWDDVNDCVLEETDETGATQVTYTHEPGPNGPLISEYRNGTTYTHHYDALGSTTMLTDDAGTVSDTFQYDAWGNQVARTGTTPTPYTWVGRWGYQDDSATTGGFYIRERSYQPTVARWMSVDPLWPMSVLNAYSYASVSPSFIFDPSGLKPRIFPQGNADAVLFTVTELTDKSVSYELIWAYRVKAGNYPADATQVWQGNWLTVFEIDANCETILSGPVFKHDVHDFKRRPNGDIIDIDTQATQNLGQKCLVIDTTEIVVGLNQKGVILPQAGGDDVITDYHLIKQILDSRNLKCVL